MDSWELTCPKCDEPLCPQCGGCYNLDCPAAACSDPEEEHNFEE